MYRLPEDFNGDFLIGRTLEQVCFTQNQVSLHFDEDVSVIIESAFSYQKKECKTELSIIAVPVFESNIMALLGCSIAEAYGDVSGTLTMLFSNDYSLKCYDNSDEYESYHIRHRQKIIIV